MAVASVLNVVDVVSRDYNDAADTKRYGIARRSARKRTGGGTGWIVRSDTSYDLCPDSNVRSCTIISEEGKEGKFDFALT
jgi:hypothetical protein